MEKQLSQTVLSQYLSIKNKKESENTQVTNRKRKTILGEEREAKRHEGSKMSNQSPVTTIKTMDNDHINEMEKRLET